MEPQITFEGSVDGVAIDDAVHRWLSRVERVIPVDACEIAIRIKPHLFGRRLRLVLALSAADTYVDVTHIGSFRHTDDALSLISAAFRDAYHRLAPPERRNARQLCTSMPRSAAKATAAIPTIARSSCAVTMIVRSLASPAPDLMSMRTPYGKSK